MRWFYSIMVFTIVLSLSIWLVEVFGLTAVALPAQYGPSSIADLFSLDIFRRNFMWAGVGLVAAAAGISGLLLRQNTYALYALVIFAVASFIPVVSDFIFAVPRVIDSVMFLYPEYNPFSGLVSGPYAGTNPWSLVFVAVQTFAGFMYIMSKVTGGSPE